MVILWSENTTDVIRGGAVRYSIWEMNWDSWGISRTNYCNREIQRTPREVAVPILETNSFRYSLEPMIPQGECDEGTKDNEILCGRRRVFDPLPCVGPRDHLAIGRETFEPGSCGQGSGDCLYRKKFHSGCTTGGVVEAKVKTDDAAVLVRRLG